MAKLILLVIISLVLTSISSTRCRGKKHKDNDDRNAMQRFTYAITALTGKYLYLHLLQNPTQSYTTVTLPIACIVGHLAYHAEGDEYKEMLKLIGLKNKNEIQYVLSNAVSAINNRSDTKSKISFKVFRENSKKFTQTFEQEFIDICNGETGSANYNCPGQALETVNEWYTRQSETYELIPLKNSNMFSKNDKQGIVYATYMDFVTSFDHEANPNVLKSIDYEVSENVTLKFPSLYGAGYFKYAKLHDLDAQVFLMYLKGGKHFAVFFYPNKAENLLELMKIIQDPKVYYGCIKRAKWMCLKVHITVGHAEVSNDLFEFVPELKLNETNLKNVFECGDAHVNYGFQQLHLIGDTEVRKGPMNSKLCPGKNLPFVKMNHNCAYYVMANNGMNIYAGMLNLTD